VPIGPILNQYYFCSNLKTTIHEPISIYPGNGTNFCGYGALSYLFLQDDPLGYAKLLLELYKEGKASFANVVFAPSEAIKKEAGRLRYKGVLEFTLAELNVDFLSTCRSL